MEIELISFETAKLAKEKGFNYKKNLWNIDKDSFDNLPSQSLLQKWLRDIHKIQISIDNTAITNVFTYNYTIKWFNHRLHFKSNDLEIRYDTYESSVEKSLQEALKLI